MAKLTSAIEALNEINENQKDIKELLASQIKLDMDQDAQKRRDEIAADKGDKKSFGGNFLKKAMKPVSKVSEGVTKGAFDVLKETFASIVGFAFLNWISKPENVEKLKNVLKTIFEGVQWLYDSFQDVAEKFTKFKETWDKEGFYSAVDELTGGEGFFTIAGAALAALGALAIPFTMMLGAAKSVGKAWSFLTGTNVADDAAKKAKEKAKQLKEIEKNKPKDLKTKTVDGKKMVQAKSGKFYDVNSTQGKAITTAHADKVAKHDASVKAAKADLGDGIKNGGKKSPKITKMLGRGAGIFGALLSAGITAAEIQSVLSGEAEDSRKKELISGIISQELGGVTGAVIGGALGTDIGGPLGAVLGSMGGYFGGAALGKEGLKSVGDLIAGYLVTGDVPSWESIKAVLGAEGAHWQSENERNEKLRAQQSRINSASSEMTNAKMQYDAALNVYKPLRENADKNPALLENEGYLKLLNDAGDKVRTTASAYYDARLNHREVLAANKSVMPSPAPVPQTIDAGPQTNAIADAVAGAVKDALNGVVGVNVVNQNNTTAQTGTPLLIPSVQTQKTP